MRWVVLPALLLTATSATAQQVDVKRVEVAPIVSFARGAEIEMDTAGVDDLTVNGGVTWGAAVTFIMSTHWALEGLAAFQSSAVAMETPVASGELLSTRVHQYHGSVVYQFGGRQARVRPFVLGGTGATVLNAPDFKADLKVSWIAGGGVKWMVWERLGVTTDARYIATMLHDTPDSFCGPFTFCQGTLNHLRIGGGVFLSY